MYFVGWLFLVEAIVIVTVNIVTIVIFTRTPRLRCRKYFLIVNLAVADLFVGLVSVPMFTASTIDKNIARSITFMTIYRAQDPSFAAASLFSFAAVAIERVYATYYPFKHRALSTLTYKIGIATVWACAFVSSMAIVVCNVVIQSVYNLVLISTIIAIVVIAVPISAVAVSYFLIWVKVSFKKNIPHHAIHHSNAKLTITLAIVTLVSLIAWMPFMVASVLWSFCTHGVLDCPNLSQFFKLDAIWEVLKFLHYGNSFINFIIYVVRMREFRAEILRRIRCGANPAPRVRPANTPATIQLNNVAVAEL